MRLRINELIGLALYNGVRKSKAELARLLWPDSSEVLRRMAINRLAKGKAKTIRIDHLCIIADYFGVKTIDELICTL